MVISTVCRYVLIKPTDFGLSSVMQVSDIQVSYAT